MSSTTDSTGPMFFASASALRAWFREHSADADELLIGYYKQGTGEPGLRWQDSVDEALCVGWLDGLRKRIDGERYQVRFMPRSPGGQWSPVHLARAGELLAAGRMQVQGIAAFAQRAGADAPAPVPGVARAPAIELKAFRRNKAAWAYFESQSPAYRQAVLRWIDGVQRQDTRDKRMAEAIDASANRRKLFG